MLRLIAKRSFLLLSIFYLFNTVLFAQIEQASGQSIKFKRISLEEGLSQSVVYSIFQDSKGFMWFGTWAGLNKYDGYNFKVYKHEPGNPNSLSNNIVRSICEDQSGALWIGTRDGLNKFDREKEKFTQYKNEPNNPNSLSNNNVRSICEDQSGVLWIGTRGGGLNKLVPSDTEGSPPTFTHYKKEPDNPHSLSSNNVWSIYEDQSGVLWIGTLAGLNKFDREKETFTQYKNEPNKPNSLSGNQVESICEDQSGVLWIGTRDGLNKLVPSDNEGSPPTFTHYKNEPNNPNSLSHNNVRSICEDQSGVLWIGTRGGGLNKLVPGDTEGSPPTFTHYKNEPNNPSSLSNNRVWTIYEDQSGALWIGTDGGGLNEFDRKKEKFVHHKKDPNNPNSLSNNIVWSIYEDQSGVLWIGTRDGLNKLVPGENEGSPPTFTHYKNEPNNLNSLSNNEVWSIHEDQSGVLWIGTNRRLHKFDRETGEFTQYKNPNGLSSNKIGSIYEDQSGMLWLGTDGGGLNKFDREKEKFTQYKNEPNNPNSLSHNHVNVIYEDQSGVLWIGTRGGLDKLVPAISSGPALRDDEGSVPTFMHYKNDPNNPNSLSNNTVMSIYEDQSGVLWIATIEGLNKFDSETEKFIHYTEKDGLPGQVIYGILEDNHGNLWLSTNKGVSKFNPSPAHSPPGKAGNKAGIPHSSLSKGGSKGAFRNYDVRDGLQSNEFNEGPHHKSRSGWMFFGGINGFNAFHPDSVKDNPHIPPIVITDFKIFNQSVPIRTDGDSYLQKSIEETEEITLVYKDNFFSFEFSALDYTIPEKNQYAYMMQGFDRDWIYSGTRRYASYTNLDPGDYIFRVKGANNDGIWNEVGTSVRITITPPWWRTNGAYVFYLLLTGVTLYGWRQFDVKRTQLKNELKLKEFEGEKLKEVDHLKSRFFANISHEFRTPLTLIIDPLKEMMAGQFKGDVTQQYGVMHRSARRLLRLINQLLDLAKLEARGMALQASRDNVVSFLKGIVNAFASLAETRRIELRFRAEEEEIELYFDRDKLEKILNNLLSNALKFTREGGEISVTVSTEPPFNFPINKGGLRGVQITVKDTGIGIASERLSYIFDRFYQVDSSRTREHEGTGIGLALSKELVALHHGEIHVTSREGKGTEFVILLPLGKEHLQEDEIVDTPLDPPSRGEFTSELVEPETESSAGFKPSEGFGEKTVILVVEDNADVRNYIRQHLEPVYEVAEAKDGVLGVELALKTIPDLIISDVMMPNLDGYELCRKLKQEIKTSHIPIILLTAKAEEQDKLAGLETGADDYLIKPFNSAELLARVKNLIELRRKLQEKYRRDFLLEPGEVQAVSAEEEFLQRACTTVAEHLSDPEFHVEQLVRHLHLSRVSLHRKLRALVDQSASEFIRSLRLKRAAQLLKQETGNITEIAFQVGFSSSAYFTQCFHAQFGCSPSEYKRTGE